MSSVIKRAHFAFRQDGDAWAGGHSNYEVKVTPTELSVRPYEPKAEAASPIRFGTSQLRRSNRALGTEQAQAKADATDGHLVLSRGDVEEHLRNGEDGVEQSWRFAAKPIGTGALEVRVPILAGTFRGESTSGLHFEDGRTGLGVRYGHATWIDARGAKTSVTARFEANAIVLRVPADVLEGAAYPAVLDPIIGPELAVEVPISGAASSIQYQPEIASTGSEFLVVWSDNRLSSNSDVFGARVSAAGVVLDPTGFPISMANGFQGELSVSWGGSQYLVSWMDNRNGNFDIYGARVSPAGVVLDPAGLAIATGGTPQWYPSVASNGSTFLVSWNENGDLFGARVSAAGVVDAPIVISNAAQSQTDPSIAFDGTNFFVVWTDGRSGNNDVYGARVSNAGVVLDPAGLLIASAAGNQQMPAVAWNGTNFYVAWQDYRAGNSDVYGTRVSASGARLDASDVLLSGLTTAEAGPRVDWNGTSWFVFWMDQRSGNSDVYAARVSAAGANLDASGLVIASGAGAQTFPSVAVAGTSLFAVWANDFGVGNDDIYGSLINANGTVATPGGTRISSAAANKQGQPALAWSGTQYLLVWTDFRGGNSDLYGTRMTADGTIIGSAFPISTAANSQQQQRIATNGTDFFVVWTDYRRGASPEVYGARVSAAGSVLDPAGLPIGVGGSSQQAPDVTWNGSNYLVVWTDNRIVGTRISPAGANLDSSGLLIGATPNTSQGQPSVAWDGTNHLVTWVDRRTGNYNVYARRLTAAGVGVDASDLVISSAPGDEFGPLVSWNGTSHFIVWGDQRAGNADVYGARVSAAGTVLDPAPNLAIATGPGWQTASDLGWDGVTHFVLWTDEATLRVRGARLSTAGVVLDVPALTVSSGPREEWSGGARASAPQQWLASYYSTFDPTPGWGTARTIVRRLNFNEPPTATAQTLTTNEDTALALTLTATDPEANPLTFTVVTQPAHGALTGTPPNLTYTPAADYFGPDSFTFKANDGSVDSAVATITLNVTAVNDAPVATVRSFSVAEDSSIEITLEGTDIDSPAITCTVVDAPAYGTLTGASPIYRYTPNANYWGADSINFKCNDRQLDSALATIFLSVSGVNDAPVANAQTVSTAEDTATTLTLTASDLESTSLTYTVLSAPVHGTLSGTAPNLTYTPAPNYAGPDFFTFKARDNALDSAPAIVTINVTPVNDAPVAQARSLSVPEDTTLSLLLAALDPDNTTLTYVVVTQPAHGTLGGSGANLTYTPAADYSGPDAFTFKANDGTVDSATATISITVTPVNDAPVASAQTVNATEDVTAAITLQGTDAEGSALSFVVVRQPAHGTLSGTAPNLVYTPAQDFFGSDSFTFKANDGTTDSVPSTVTLAVAPVNDPPLIQARTLRVSENGSLSFALSALDVDDTTFTFTIVTQPTHGTISGTSPNLTYTPAPNYFGADAIVFKANDGDIDSAAGQWTIQVSPVNSAPVVAAQSLTVNEDTALAVVLGGSDPEGDSLSYSIVTQPAHGTLTGTAPNVSYTPARDFNGTDTFTFKANDGTLDSAAGTITVSVTAVNDAPVATAQARTVGAGPTTITLAGTDVDGDSLTYTIATMPTQGTVTGTPPAVTFTPPVGFSGQTTFTFTASDGRLDSTATVTLSVISSAGAPVVAANASTLRPLEGENVLFRSSAQDPAGEALTFSWDFGDGTTSTDQNPTHAYAAEGDFTAVLTVSDGTDSTTARLSITVTNKAPQLMSITTPAMAEEAKPVSFHAEGTDADALTFTWDFGDGSAPVQGVDVTHAWADDGVYTVKLTASDGSATTVATRQVHVSNLPPQLDEIANADAQTGTPLSVTLHATDVAGENDPIEYAIADGPGRMSAEGVYTWTPKAGDEGPHVIKVRATDDEGGVGESVFTVTVTTGASEPPASGCSTTSSTELFAIFGLLGVWLRRRRARNRSGLSELVEEGPTEARLLSVLDRLGQTGLVLSLIALVAASSCAPERAPDERTRAAEAFTKKEDLSTSAALVRAYFPAWTPRESRAPEALRTTLPAREGEALTLETRGYTFRVATTTPTQARAFELNDGVAFAGSRHLWMTGSDRVEEFEVQTSAGGTWRSSYRLQLPPGTWTLRDASDFVEVGLSADAPVLRLHHPEARDAKGQVRKGTLVLSALEASGSVDVKLELKLDGLEGPVVIDPGFSATNTIGTEREFHTATLLPNGNLLIVGGQGNGATAADTTAIYRANSNAWFAGATLPSPRTAHAATLLSTGKVLIAGGRTYPAYDAYSSTLLYDVSAGTFSAGPSMNAAREGLTATLLPNGKVLVVGGRALVLKVVNGMPTWVSGTIASAELFDPATGTWSDAGSVGFDRWAHSATLLLNGKVLVAGGQSLVAGGNTALTHLYDPATNTWSAASPMPRAKAFQPASLLPDGRVLVSGGGNSSFPAAFANLYDPVANTWGPDLAQVASRTTHTSTLMPNGRVMLVAGSDFLGFRLNTAEFFDPPLGTFTATGSMASAREAVQATLLPDGKALVVGGLGTSGAALSSAEVFDPAVGTWAATGSLGATRTAATLTTMPNNNKVLIAGGSSGGVRLASAELYDPATGTWSAAPSMSVPRLGAAAVYLPSGKAFLTGGETAAGVITASTEIYDPNLNAWYGTAAMSAPRWGHTATRLPTGDILVTGGFGPSGAVATAELYSVGTDTWRTIAPMSAARARHTATLLPSGRVLIAGGTNGSGPVATAQIYVTEVEVFSAVPAMTESRDEHTATLLPSGKVLVTGGNGPSGPRTSTETYDPSLNVFYLSGNLNAARTRHAATVLLNGKVLLAAGMGASSTRLASAELFEEVSKSPLRAQHTVTGPATITTGAFTITGTNLFGPSGGSSTYSDSSRDSAQFALQELNGAQWEWLNGSPTSATSAQGIAPPQLPTGPYILWSFVSGVRTGKVVNLTTLSQALAQTVAVTEDTPRAIVLQGWTARAMAVSYAVATPPAHGTLTGTAPNLTYTPAANYFGPDSFTFTVYDGRTTSLPATVTINVANVNDAPVATGQTPTVNEDTPLVLALGGSDIDGDPLTYTVVTQPTNGTLTGTGSSRTYTPAANYAGPDSFTFKVNDGQVDSAVVTVSITVTPVNDAPVGTAQALTLAEDTTRSITLSGTDVENSSLTFAIVSGPTRGSLSGTPPNLVYTPAANFFGTDSFTFKVNDGTVDSAPATISLTVTPVNDAPTANAGACTTQEDVSCMLSLSAVDVDGDVLTWAAVSLPAHGTLSGNWPNLTFTPAANYAGADSFTFRVNDGQVNSPMATVSLTITPVNDAPSAIGSNLTTAEDTATTLTLQGSDPEGTALTFAFTQPAHGALTGTPPNLTYTPVANYQGPDSFTFTASDGVLTSAAATISVQVTPVNDAPVGVAASLTVAEDTALALVLQGTDPENDALTFTVLSQPANGTLSGTAPNLTYTPAANYAGADSFTFRARDGALDSATTTVSITVTAVNDAPIANASSATTTEDAPVTLTLTGSDVEGSAVTFAVVTQPVHGSLSGAPPNPTYTPAADYAGPDSFTFKANDGTADSTPATVTITVTAVNDAPVAAAVSLSVAEGSARAFTLTATDVDSTALSFEVLTQPAHGVLSGTAPDLTYTPTAHFAGPDSFTYRAGDGALWSSPATVTVNVGARNDAPVATSQSFTLDEDQPQAIVLSGTDLDADPLTFSVVTQPAHGTLSGTAPNLTYTPTANFHGADSFTFKANDGTADSVPVAITFTITSINDAPEATAQTVLVGPGTTALTLAGTDADGDSLTYAIATMPAQGTLSGTPPNVTFTAPVGFHGQTTFTFTASDGTLTSAPGTITISVSNGPPVVAASASTLRPHEAENVLFTGSAQDPAGDPVTVSWDFGDGTTSTEANPTHAYANEGTFTATFTASDGTESTSAMLSITVINAKPVVVPLDVPATAEEAKPITFHAEASDTDALTFTWNFGDGTATVEGKEATHTYADDGTYTVTLSVSDGTDTTVETREIIVSNLPPQLDAVAAQEVKAGTQLTVTLHATDVAGERDPITYSLASGPGSVSASGEYTWTPGLEETGPHVIKVRATDDDEGSGETVFTVNVTPGDAITQPTGCGCSQSSPLELMGLFGILGLWLSRRTSRRRAA